MPCSHLFAIMKVENLEAIKKCMILLRWTKQAKLGMRAEIQGTWTHQYMAVEARLGSLYAACRTLQKVVAKSSEAYDIAIVEVHELTIQLQAMSSEATKDKPKGDLGNDLKLKTRW